jgi:hypothetical protein
MCRVTSPVRIGVQRSLLCFHVPEKFEFGGEQIPVGARSSAGSQTRNNRLFIFAGFYPGLLRLTDPSLEIQTQRQLHLARRSRAHRGYRIYDGRVQVNRVDDAAEPRRARRVESGLRLA